MGTNHQPPNKSERNHFWVDKTRISELSSVTHVWLFNSYLVSFVGWPDRCRSHHRGNALLHTEILNFCKDKENLSCKSWTVMVRPSLQEDTCEMSLRATGGVGKNTSQTETRFLHPLKKRVCLLMVLKT